MNKMTPMRLLIIIPCFNEESRLKTEDILHFFEQTKGEDYRLLFVNDGSTDNTLGVLKELSQQEDKIEVLNIMQNVGKAEAIRQGMLQNSHRTFDYFGYFDADLATPLSEIDRFAKVAEKKNPLVILGSRIKILGTTDISRNPARHYIGRVFATIVSNMLKLPIYDTQCGAKLIQHKALPPLFEKPFVSKWLFDVELLFRLKNAFDESENKIVEVPVKKWKDVSGSKISTVYFIKAPFDLLKIYFRYKR